MNPLRLSPTRFQLFNLAGAPRDRLSTLTLYPNIRQATTSKRLSIQRIATFSPRSLPASTPLFNYSCSLPGLAGFSNKSIPQGCDSQIALLAYMKLPPLGRAFATPKVHLRCREGLTPRLACQVIKRYNRINRCWILQYIAK